LQPIIPGFLSVLEPIIGIIGLPLFVLLLWFSHQNTKRIAYLHFHPVAMKHLPEQLQDDYQWILNQLTKFGPVVETDGKVLRGAVEEILNRIRNVTGSKIAERILHIYHQLNCLYMEGIEKS
jgi:hypothetical protein